jgi:hypothetical protein
MLIVPPTVYLYLYRYTYVYKYISLYIYTYHMTYIYIYTYIYIFIYMYIITTHAQVHINTSYRDAMNTSCSRRWLKKRPAAHIKQNRGRTRAREQTHIPTCLKPRSNHARFARPRISPSQAPRPPPVVGRGSITETPAPRRRARRLNSFGGCGGV